MMHDAQMVEHERDVAAVRMEWKAVPEACMMTAAMLEMMHQALSGLTVNTDRMRANLDLLGGFLMSERVMFALAEKVGKQSAHELVYAAAMQGMEASITFEQALLRDAAVRDAWIPHHSGSSWTRPLMLGWRQQSSKRSSKESGQAAGSTDRIKIIHKRRPCNVPSRQTTGKTCRNDAAICSRCGGAWRASRLLSKQARSRDCAVCRWRRRGYRRTAAGSVSFTAYRTAFHHG